MNKTYFIQEDTGGTKYISRFGSQSTGAIETTVICGRETIVSYSGMQDTTEWRDPAWDQK